MVNDYSSLKLNPRVVIYDRHMFILQATAWSLHCLFNKKRKNFKHQIREDGQQGVYIENLSEFTVCDPEKIFELMKQGERNRHYGATNMNDKSSRYLHCLISFKQTIKICQ